MKIKNFLDDFIYYIEMDNKFFIKIMSQYDVKCFLDDNIEKYGREFSMICYENTEDSFSDVDFDDSKFLNDKAHDNTWIVGEQYGEVVFIICLKEDDNELEIDTFEVSSRARGNKIASYVIKSVEYNAYKYYESIYLIPFDTNASNFWQYQGYEPDYRCHLKKTFKNYDE